MTRVLLAYASKRGSTAETLEAVADALRNADLDVDYRAAGDVAALEPYDAVVLGSAIYIKRWQADAKHFLRRHASYLARVPFGAADPRSSGAARRAPSRRVRRRDPVLAARPDRGRDRNMIRVGKDTPCIESQRIATSTHRPLPGPR
jgi:menaquinone-dependent protoporphyrinogen oxidase